MISTSGRARLGARAGELPARPKDLVIPNGSIVRNLLWVGRSNARNSMAFRRGVKRHFRRVRFYGTLLRSPRRKTKN
jgi:hypothetical protein